MSQEYIANINRGDQSNMPFLHASLVAVINEPAIREFADEKSIVYLAY